MTIDEAREIVEEFDVEISNPTDEDIFVFTEAMDFLINEEHNPADMMYLGGVYYEMERFDLALKYYEMAAALDYDEAYECLGYIWYYGRTGKKDYKKAFECFSKGMEKGSLVATYKIADMYKNGYYVNKDVDKYKEIMEELYPCAIECESAFDVVPEIFTRVARIRRDEGREKEAIDFFFMAREWLAERIQYNAYFGNLNMMKWLNDDLYELIDFDYEIFDLFDLYYLLRTPHKINFKYKGKIQSVESVMEGEECSVCFNGKWYRDRDDFFKGAVIGETNEKLTSIWKELYEFEVVE